MNPRNVKKFDTGKADLKRSVMRLWQENDWNMTDAHFEGLRKKLHEGGYRLPDLQQAVTEYTRDDGTHAPRFGDLVIFLRSYRRIRLTKLEQEKMKAEAATALEHIREIREQLAAPDKQTPEPDPEPEAEGPVIQDKDARRSMV